MLNLVVSLLLGFVFFETQRGYHWRALDSLVKDEPKYQLKMGVDLDPEKAAKVDY